MTSTAMIIENKLSCVWLRSRDAALLLVSGILWGNLFATLPGAEFSRMSPLAYLALVITIAATCFAWAAVSKAYFNIDAELGGRRLQGAVRANAIAAHFGIDGASLATMQHAQTIVIHHAATGQIVSIVSTPSAPIAPRAAAAADESRLSQAA